MLFASGVYSLHKDRSGGHSSRYFSRITVMAQAADSGAANAQLLAIFTG